MFALTTFYDKFYDMSGLDRSLITMVGQPMQSRLNNRPQRNLIIEGGAFSLYFKAMRLNKCYVYGLGYSSVQSGVPPVSPFCPATVVVTKRKR